MNPTVKGNYKKGSPYGSALNAKKLTQVRRVIQGFKDNYITSKTSQYDKVRIAFNYLRVNCAYAWKGWQYNGANNAWGALVYGKAQCSGFTRAMKALCDSMGIKCYVVNANKKSANPSHVWNVVKVNGKAYILDAQGGLFLVGTKTYKEIGLRWNSSGLPKISTNDHKNGGSFGPVI